LLHAGATDPGAAIRVPSDGPAAERTAGCAGFKRTRGRKGTGVWTDRLPAAR